MMPTKPWHWIAWATAAMLAAASVPASDFASADAVIEAERAFAADTSKNGFKRGFLAHVAEQGIIFQPGPVLARAQLQALPDAAPPGAALNWWPQFAGISNAGDFGFTTGAANIPVRYFTVWQKQPDGRWKWIYDGGPALKSRLPGAPDGPVRHLPPAAGGAGSPERALAEIAPLEADLAAMAATDPKAAHLKYLAEDGLTAGSPEPSTIGRDSQTAELERRPAATAMKPLGGAASNAGDMAFTYGEVRWVKEEPRWGHYARIWQKRREGWKLVADMVVAAPGAPLPSKIASR